jgi:hypothetical protein
MFFIINFSNKFHWLCWYRPDRQRGKKEQTLCLYNCVQAKPLAICFATNVIVRFQIVNMA